MLLLLLLFLLFSLAIHDLDIARWLMGSRGANEPVRIYATGACNVDKSILELKDSNPSEAIDTANILIEFESGSTATIQVKHYMTHACRMRCRVLSLKISKCRLD